MLAVDVPRIVRPRMRHVERAARETLRAYGLSVGMGLGVDRSEVKTASGPFPLTRADLVGWWSIQRSTLTFNGTRVSGGSDLGPNGWSMSQATSGRQALYNATGINGKPSLNIDSAARSMQTSTSLTLAQPFTWVWVGYATDPTDATFTTQIPFCNGSAFQSCFATDNTRTEAYLYGGGTTRMLGPTGTKTMLASPVVAVCVFNGASSVFRMGGAETSGNAGSATITAGVSWGASGSTNAFSLGMVGFTGELQLYSSAFDATTRASAETWAKGEWGIS